MKEATANKKALSSILFLVVDGKIEFNDLKTKIAKNNRATNSKEFKKSLKSYGDKGDELENRLEELKQASDSIPTFPVSLITSAIMSMRLSPHTAIQSIQDVDEAMAEFNAATMKAKTVLAKSKVTPKIEQGVLKVVTDQGTAINELLSTVLREKSELLNLQAMLKSYHLPQVPQRKLDNLDKVEEGYRSKERQNLESDMKFVKLVKDSNHLVAKAIQNLNVQGPSSVHRG